jgi:NTP-dependent ternary system trypsin peptidase co-occuring protein
MSARMIVELPAGQKILFGGRGPETGLAEVGVAEEITRAAGDKFKAALSSLSSLIAVLEERVGHMAHRPDKIEMEFRATLSRECDLWIVSGEGEAEFKVTLSWGKVE